MPWSPFAPFMFPRLSDVPFVRVIKRFPSFEISILFIPVPSFPSLPSVPLRPASPFSPFSPCTPWLPLSPLSPFAPTTGPRFSVRSFVYVITSSPALLISDFLTPIPSEPLRPFSPLSPFSPFAPCKPCSPLSPLSPFAPTTAPTLAR